MNMSLLTELTFSTGECTENNILDIDKSPSGDLKKVISV